MRSGQPHELGIKLGLALVSALAGLGLGLALVPARKPPALIENVVARGLEGVFDERDRLLAEQPDFVPADPLGLGRFAITKEWARELFPQLSQGGLRYDPACYYTRKLGSSYRTRFREHPSGGWEARCNSLGLRGEELLADPDARVVVTGDSHTEGVCAAEERLTSLLQAGLRSQTSTEVEVVNAAVGGFDFYNYLGMFEKLRYLEPDVFVVVVYGGNDFVGPLLVHHLFAGTRRSRSDAAYQLALAEATQVSEPAISQEFLQLFFLTRHPPERDIALRAARDVTLAIERACREAGTRLLVVYLPPLGDVQRERYEPVCSAMAQALDLSEEDLGLTDRLAEEWMQAVSTAGVRVLDLRPTFRAATEDLYWHSEHHLSTEGHALVAAEVLLALAEEDR